MVGLRSLASQVAWPAGLHRAWGVERTQFLMKRRPSLPFAKADIPRDLGVRYVDKVMTVSIAVTVPNKFRLRAFLMFQTVKTMPTPYHLRYTELCDCLYSPKNQPYQNRLSHQAAMQSLNLAKAVQ